MSERPKAVPAVYLILERDGKILLLLRKNVSYFPDHWGVPAGHVELDELPTKAMVREAEEEAGIRVQLEDLRLVHTMYRDKHDATGERVDFFFTAEQWEGEPVNGEPDKCADVEWFPKDQLPENLVPNQAYALESIRRGEVFSEYPTATFAK